MQEIEEKGTSELFLINEVKEGRKIERERKREKVKRDGKWNNKHTYTYLNA